MDTHADLVIAAVNTTLPTTDNVENQASNVQSIRPTYVLPPTPEWIRSAREDNNSPAVPVAIADTNAHPAWKKPRLERMNTDEALALAFDDNTPYGVIVDVQPNLPSSSSNTNPGISTVDQESATSSTISPPPRKVLRLMNSEEAAATL